MKMGYVLAAVAAAAISLPSIASAETTIIKKKVYRDGPRAEMVHRDHGWHRGWRHHHHHADRVVVIHKHRY